VSANDKLRAKAKALYLVCMMLRPPRYDSSRVPKNALDYEIAHEQAAALGRLGRALEAALAALSRYDQARAQRGEELPAPTSPAATARERLVQEASYALWCFVIQREASGLRDQRLVVREYRIPAEVQNRMGAFGGTRPTAASA
jgi:hypothetical protein